MISPTDQGPSSLLGYNIEFPKGPSEISPLAVVRIKVLFKHAIWLRRGAPCPLWPVEFAGQWLFTLHNDQNSQGTPMPLDSRTDIHPLSAPWLAAVFGAS